MAHVQRFKCRILGKMMSGQKYRYTIAVEFDAVDDIEARELVGMIRNDVEFRVALNTELRYVSFKLQRMYRDRPPERVDMLEDERMKHEGQGES